MCDVNAVDSAVTEAFKLVTDEDNSSISLPPAVIDVSVVNFVTVISELISFWIAFRLLYMGTKSTVPPPPLR